MAAYPPGEIRYNMVLAFPNSLDTPRSREQLQAAVEALAAVGGGALISLEFEREKRDRPLLDHKVLLTPEVQARLETPIEELLQVDGAPIRGPFTAAANKIRKTGVHSARDSLLAGKLFFSDIRGVGSGEISRRIATNLGVVCPEISFDYAWDAADAAQFCPTLNYVGACALGSHTNPRQTIADLRESPSGLSGYTPGFADKVEAYATMFTQAQPAQ